MTKVDVNVAHLHFAGIIEKGT